MSKAVLKGSAGPWVMAASTEECILGIKSGSKTSGKSERSQQPPTKCPECSSLRIWKDGLRYVKSETGTIAIQRYICRSCGRRFSETDPAPPSPSRRNLSPGRKRNVDLFGSYLKPNTTAFKANLLTSTCRVCVSEREAKNLVKVETRQKGPMREGTAQTADVKGKIVEFLWELKKQGYSKATMKTYGEALNTVVRRGANIFDSESVKEVLAKAKFSEATKHIVIAGYSKFLETQGEIWKPPICQVSRKLPFIPLNREIDDLIAGCGKKTSTFLQVLKETAMRSGEALRLKWTDIDFKRKIVIFNEPEKHGNPRVFNISSKLIEMLNSLPKKSDRVFNGSSLSMRSNYVKARKRLARKLGNPRLQRITFHTLRHWKATTEYHKTKDPIHVMAMLGHKSMNTTLLYIQLEKTLFKESSDEFTVKVAKNPERIKALLEVGFEYVCEKDDLMFFRKRK